MVKCQFRFLEEKWRSLLSSSGKLPRLQYTVFYSCNKMRRRYDRDLVPTAAAYGKQRRIDLSPPLCWGQRCDCDLFPHVLSGAAAIYFRMLRAAAIAIYFRIFRSAIAICSAGHLIQCAAFAIEFLVCSSTRIFYYIQQ